MISFVNKTIRRLTPLVALLAMYVTLSPADALLSAAPLPQDPIEDSTQIHAGIFRANPADSSLVMGLEWNAFLKEWQSLEGKGFRMVDLETYTEGSKRLYAGVFRPGTDAKGAIVGQEWAPFYAEWQNLEKKNLRMIDFETYTSGGKRLYAGIFRAGAYDVDAYIGKPWNDFHAKWQEFEGKNLRMVDIEIYEAGGQTLYAGIFHAGRDAKGALVGLEWSEFDKQAADLKKSNLRMIDFETYVSGGKRLYAGIFRAGTDGHALWVGVDEENFSSQSHNYGKSSLRLSDLEVYSSPWEASCLNQVMPETGNPYTRNIKSTPLHCEGQPGTCGTPGANATVLYSAPWYFDGKQRYVRLSAIAPVDKFLTLPFNDAAVKYSGLWRYSSNTYHHAGDYSQGETTFQLRASAPGKLIHIGWDSWGGGTVIVSHNVAGGTDNYRTIFRHVRNGADNDCDAAWNISVPSLKGDDLTDYKAYLEMSGCTQKKADRKLQEKFWGKNSEAIDMSLLGKNVTRGQALAWTGNTGPGGKKGTGAGANTHLHIFWARRDPTDMKWYLFDPYGIYAGPACYPGITDAVTGTHARYGNAWKDSKPQFPQL
ncbi:MAG TPA: hypothetical protein VF703_05295 [Pyrinomonadaceae bacterium]|jgi:hypothetical protein